MDVTFLFKCFLIGIFAASGFGPIFILTFNRSAVCGFWKGFSTAFGASLADCLYFLLGMLGALAVISELSYIMIFLDLLGGILLLFLGVRAIRRVREVVCVTVECSQSIFLSIIKAFIITILNPLVIFFFMAVTLQVLPEEAVRYPLSFVILSSFFVFLGSLAVLSAVSLVASFVGSCIPLKKFRIISAISGVGFILFGIYLLYDFVSQSIKFFYF